FSCRRSWAAEPLARMPPVGFCETKPIRDGRWVCLCKTLSLSPARPFTKRSQSGPCGVGFVRANAADFIQLSEIMGGIASCEDVPLLGFLRNKANPEQARFASL